jgi:hypothetical protein
MLEPLYVQEAHLQAASNAAGSKRFRERYGWYATIVRVARLKPTFDAIYGDRGPVTGLPVWDVLYLLAHDRDADALEGRIHKAYQQRISQG